MFIKRIAIEGFKLFKNRTVLDHLPDGLVMIAGHNGSGKSSVIDALQFVLTDKYANLSHDDRSQLFTKNSLADGGDVAVAGNDHLSRSATVEVTLDNASQTLLYYDHSDNIPNIITIRRTLTYKKDEYFINNQLCQKSDLFALLQPLGLGSSNVAGSTASSVTLSGSSLSFVEQNSISKLITMGDYGRLELLMNAAGTIQYDQRRAESIKTMNATDDELKDVDLLLGTLANRLGTLSKERKKLITYEYLLHRKRNFDLHIYQTKLATISKNLQTYSTKYKDIRRQVLNMSKQQQDDGKKYKMHDEKEDEDEDEDGDDALGAAGNDVIDVEYIKLLSKQYSELQQKIQILEQDNIECKKTQEYLNNELIHIKVSIVEKAGHELSLLQTELTQDVEELNKVKQLIIEMNSQLLSNSVKYDELLEELNTINLQLQLLIERKQIIMYHNEQKSGKLKDSTENGANIVANITKTLQKEIILVKKQLEEKQTILTEYNAKKAEINNLMNNQYKNSILSAENDILANNAQLLRFKNTLKTMNNKKSALHVNLSALMSLMNVIETNNQASINVIYNNVNYNANLLSSAKTGRFGKNDNTSNNTLKDALVAIDNLIMRYQIWLSIQNPPESKLGSRNADTNGMIDVDDDYDEFAEIQAITDSNLVGNISLQQKNPRKPKTTPSGSVLLDGVDYTWVRGVYGPICNLISWPNEMNTPITTLFGTRLYFILVDSPSTAVTLRREIPFGGYTIIPVSALQGYQKPQLPQIAKKRGILSQHDENSENDDNGVRYTDEMLQYFNMGLVTSKTPPLPQGIHKTVRIESPNAKPLLQFIRLRYNKLLLEYPDEVNGNSAGFDLFSLDDAQEEHGGDKLSVFVKKTRFFDKKYYDIKYGLRNIIANAYIVRNSEVAVELNKKYPQITCLTSSSPTMVQRLGEMTGGYINTSHIYNNTFFEQYYDDINAYIEAFHNYYFLQQQSKKLNENLTILNNNISHLLNNNNILTTRIQQFEDSIITKHYELNNVDNIVSQLQHDVDTIKNTYTNIKCKLRMYKNDVNDADHSDDEDDMSDNNGSGDKRTLYNEYIKKILLYKSDITKIDAEIAKLTTSKISLTKSVNDYLYLVTTTKDALRNNYLKHYEMLNASIKEKNGNITKLNDSLNNYNNNIIVNIEHKLKQCNVQLENNTNEHQQYLEKAKRLMVNMEKLKLQYLMCSNLSSTGVSGDMDSISVPGTSEDIDSFFRSIKVKNHGEDEEEEDGVRKKSTGRSKKTSREDIANKESLLLNNLKQQLNAIDMSIQQLILDKVDVGAKITQLTWEQKSSIIVQLLQGIDEEDEESSEDENSLTDHNESDYDEINNSSDDQRSKKSKLKYTGAVEKEKKLKTVQFSKQSKKGTHPKNIDPMNLHYNLKLVLDKTIHYLFKDDDVSKLTPMTLQQYCTQLSKVIMDYSLHTNRDGAMLYLTLKEQYNDLTKRRKDLSEARKNIIALILSLDQRKKETILTTFRLINHEFSLILSLLWNNVRGELILYNDSGKEVGQDSYDSGNNDDQEMGDEEEIIQRYLQSTSNMNNSDGSDKTGNILLHTAFKQKVSSLTENKIQTVLSHPSIIPSSDPPPTLAKSSSGFSGIGVKIVNPVTTQTLRLTAVSGGQGAQIALALLLSIQRVIGASVCILDEPDANMDSEFTESLLQVLYQFSHNSFHKIQVILTSFHTDLAIKKADMIYKVQLQHQHPFIQRFIGQAALQMKPVISAPVNKPKKIIESSESESSLDSENDEVFGTNAPLPSNFPRQHQHRQHLGDSNDDMMLIPADNVHKGHHDIDLESDKIFQSMELMSSDIELGEPTPPPHKQSKKKGTSKK